MYDIISRIKSMVVTCDYHWEAIREEMTKLRIGQGGIAQVSTLKHISQIFRVDKPVYMCISVLEICVFGQEFVLTEASNSR